MTGHTGWRRLLAGCLLGIVLTGCNQGPQLAPVSGRITVGDKAITEGVIMFHPDDGPTAVGTIQPDGTYTLTTFRPGDGAVVGKHRVSIHATRVGPGHLASPKSIDEEIELSRKRAPGGKVLVAGQITWLVPEKYFRADTSDLTAEVEVRPNIKNFDFPRP